MSNFKTIGNWPFDLFLNLTFVNLPVSVNWPSFIFFRMNTLTSGNIWVKHVVRMTPPPKQERADRKNFPLLLDVGCPITLHFFRAKGTSPKNSEIPPSRTIVIILVANKLRAMLLVLLERFTIKNQNKIMELTSNEVQYLARGILASSCHCCWWCYVSRDNYLLGLTVNPL